MAPGLGRIPSPDSRDRRFLLSALLPREEPSITHKYWWPSGWWGDQGNTPQCVAYSWVHWIEDGPITYRKRIPEYDLYALYKRCQQYDEWPGDDYDGTSVRAGAKVLRKDGYISEYRWAWDIETLIQALLQLGPAVVGTWWYDGMLLPDPDGFIKIRGRRLGGHAYVLNGINLNRGFVRIKNSWGRQWGDRGYARISLEDMERLIREDGEICMAR